MGGAGRADEEIHHTDVVGHHVVQLAGDPAPFAVDRLGGGLGVPAPVQLPSRPGALADRDQHDRVDHGDRRRYVVAVGQGRDDAHGPPGPRRKIPAAAVERHAGRHEGEPFVALPEDHNYRELGADGHGHHEGRPVTPHGQREGRDHGDHDGGQQLGEHDGARLRRGHGKVGQRDRQSQRGEHRVLSARSRQESQHLRPLHGPDPTQPRPFTIMDDGAGPRAPTRTLGPPRLSTGSLPHGAAAGVSRLDGSATG